MADSIQSGPGTKGTRHIATRWPIEEGLTAGTTRQTGERNLKAERGSLLVRKKTNF